MRFLNPFPEWLLPFGSCLIGVIVQHERGLYQFYNPITNPCIACVRVAEMRGEVQESGNERVLGLRFVAILVGTWERGIRCAGWELHPEWIGL